MVIEIDDISMEEIENSSTLNLSLFNSTYDFLQAPPQISLVAVGALLCLYTGVVILGIGGNVCVCITLVKLRTCSITHFFMCNLALSDILMGAICIPSTILSNMVFHYWPFGSFMCPVIGFLQVSSVIQRALTLMVITLDQHQVVWRPLAKRMTKRYAKMLIVILWIFASVAAIPVGMYAKVEEFPSSEGMVGVCIEDWDSPSDRRSYSIVIMILQYFLPLSIMAVSYGHICYIIWLKKTPGEVDLQRDAHQSKNKRRTVRMLITVVTVYAFSWLPLHTLTLIGDTYPQIYNIPGIDVMWLFFHWLAFSNTGINPVIYFRCNPEFRRKLMSVIACIREEPFSRSRGISLSQPLQISMVEKGKV